jgi:hypothetical protein
VCILGDLAGGTSFLLYCACGLLLSYFTALFNWRWFYLTVMVLVDCGQFYLTVDGSTLLRMFLIYYLTAMLVSCFTCYKAVNSTLLQMLLLVCRWFYFTALLLYYFTTLLLYCFTAMLAYCFTSCLQMVCEARHKRLLWLYVTHKLRGEVARAGHFRPDNNVSCTLSPPPPSLSLTHARTHTHTHTHPWLPILVHQIIIHELSGGSRGYPHTLMSSTDRQTQTDTHTYMLLTSACRADVLAFCFFFLSGVAVVAVLNMGRRILYRGRRTQRAQ